MLAALLWWCWSLQKIPSNVLLPSSNSMCEMTVKSLVLTNSGTFRIFIVFRSKFDFHYQNARNTSLVVLVTSKIPIQCVVAKF
jgi:hypothetical protein